MTINYAREGDLEALESKLAAAINSGASAPFAPDELMVLLFSLVRAAAADTVMVAIGLEGAYRQAVGATMTPHLDKIVPDWRQRMQPS